MKKLFKSLVALTAAGTMLLSTSALAASVSTVTTYNADATASVVSTVSGLSANSMVTYLATTGDGTVNEDGSNIVYIGQQTVVNSTSTTFEYDLTGVDSPTYATVKCGSNVDTFSGTNNVIGVGDVTVTINGDDGCCTVTGGDKVGVGDTIDVVIKPSTNYEVVSITKNGVQLDPTALTISAAVDDKIVVTVANTAAEPVVYQFNGAAFDDDQEIVAEDGTTVVYEKTGFARVIGNVTECGFTFLDDETPYPIDGETEFKASGVTTGYYAVQIVDTEDLSSLTPKAYAKDANAGTIKVVEISAE